MNYVFISDFVSAASAYTSHHITEQPEHYYTTLSTHTHINHLQMITTVAFYRSQVLATCSTNNPRFCCGWDLFIQRQYCDMVRMRIVFSQSYIGGHNVVCYFFFFFTLK
jgi:hypothetical protein